MQELKKVYEAIRMSDACEEKILAAVAQKKRPKRSHLRYLPALAAALALVVLLSPPVRAAVDGWIATNFPSLDLTVYHKAGDGGGMMVTVDTESPAFAYVEEGRLYFTGNGENLDITDQISEEAPYFYTYSQDEYEITLIVGYAGSLENFGTYEFIKEDGAWFTGSGRNFLNVDTDEVYPWVETVWEKLNIPWPMPGVEIDP